jgi:hypothetical protein
MMFTVPMRPSVGPLHKGHIQILLSAICFNVFFKIGSVYVSMQTDVLYVSANAS